jgi:prevent-host-death family protein
MKTITAKEFQRQHASIVKEVASGNEYEITFHRKPIIKLVPIQKKAKKVHEPGSYVALIESLDNTVKSKGDIQNIPYKQLRKRMLNQKYVS